MQQLMDISMRVLLLKNSRISQYMKNCISHKARMSSLYIRTQWQHRQTQNVDIRFGTVHYSAN